MNKTRSKRIMVTLKGITVEIDGNVTGLTKALSSLNGDIKNTTAQPGR